MSKKTTLIQIAEAADVSISTVDRVLNRRGGVTPDKEQRVLEWARKLNIDRVMFRNYLKVIRVAVLMQSPQNPFYRAVREAFTASNTARADMKISCFIHYVDLNDVKATARKIQEVSGSYEALIVVFPDDRLLSDALKMISAKIPIVTLITDLPACGRLAYVGPDNRQIGRVAGELMGRFLGSDGGEVMVVLGMHRMIGHEEREMGFRSVLRERFPLVSIVASMESGEDQTKAGQVVLETLRKNPKIAGIYNISAGNTAISKVIRTLELSQKVILITHELTSERRTMLRDGVIDAIIDQNPRREVQRSLDVLAQHFGRHNTDSAVGGFTPFSIFLRENCPPTGVDAY